MTRTKSFLLLLLLLLGCFPLFLAACAPLTPPPAARVSERGDALYLEAETLYHRQAYRQAWQLYTAYLKGNPRGRYALKARLREAEILGLLGDWQGALVRYEALLSESLDPTTRAQVQYNLGRAYYKLNQLQQASRVLEGLTAAELPGSLRFSTNALLTEIALKRRQIPTAFVRLRLAYQDLPAGDQEWFDYLRTRLVEEATPAELEHLVNLYRDSPLCAPLLLRLAQLAQKEGRPGDARQWLEILQERYPQSREARYAAQQLAPHRPLLGCLLPLSGNFAALGRRVRQGMELAAQGQPVELVFKDCPRDRKLCVQGVRALSRYPHLLAFVGPLASADAESAARAAQELGIPLISLSQKPGLTQAGDKIFQVSLMARPQIRRLVGYATNLGLRRYGIFSPNSPYGRTYSRLFQEELAGRGGVLVAQEIYPPGTRDFTFALSPLLTKFQPGTAGSPTFEALFVPDDAPTVAAILGQLTGHPLRQVQVLGTNLVRPSPGQQGLAQTLEGVLFVDAFYAGDPNPAVQKFVNAFRRRYGTQPDYLAFQGLPRRLQTLASLPEIPWFRGFNPDRQAELALYVLTIRNGRVVPAVSPASPASP